MNRTLLAAFAAFGLAAGSAAVLQAAGPGGYLAGREPDTVQVLPQVPAVGSPRDAADRAIFKATRALKGTPRWALAQNDARISAGDLAADFSCALGVKIDPAKVPTLFAMFRKMYPDLGAAFNAPKDLYKRPRPYLRDAGEICLPRVKELDESYDYPSGHATFGWVFGQILAQAAPDRATQLLARGRAFGESRAVCGVHSSSAVAEARTAGSSLMAALNGDPDFRADMDKVRLEIAALRADPAAGKGAACEAEAALIARTPW